MVESFLIVTDDVTMIIVSRLERLHHFQAHSADGQEPWNLKMALIAQPLG